MKALTIEDIKKLTSWGDIVRHYKPDVTDEEADFILWEKTCYPMSTVETIKQLNEFFKAEE